MGGMFIRSNIDVRLGKLQYIINGPEMHRWHHSDDEGREYQNNYATKLAFWDWYSARDFTESKRKKTKAVWAERYAWLSAFRDWIWKKLHPGPIAKVTWVDTIAYLKQHYFAFRRRFSGCHKRIYGWEKLEK